jgi:hypothetical protein
MFNDESYRNAVLARGGRKQEVCGVANPGGVPCTKPKGHEVGHDMASYGPETPTQPAPAGGEWRVEAEPVHGWRVIESATGRKVAGNIYYEEDARQIVAEHNAMPKLVEALQELVDLMEEVRQGEYVPDSFTTQPARIALAALATTTQPDAGEGQEQ